MDIGLGSVRNNKVQCDLIECYSKTVYILQIGFWRGNVLYLNNVGLCYQNSPLVSLLFAPSNSMSNTLLSQNFFIPDEGMF